MNFSRTIFVMDVSGSMGGLKSETLHLSVSRIVEEIQDNDFVGFVLFNSIAWIEHEVVQLTNNSIRKSLRDKIPRMNQQYTNIEDGLRKALDALKQKNLNTEKATIMLFTDGEDTTGGNYVDRVLPDLIGAKVGIISLASKTS